MRSIKVLQKYRVAFQLGLQNAMEYRADFFLSIISAIFPIAMNLFLWSAIYGNDTNEMYGYTYGAIIIYSILSSIIAKLVACGVESEIAGDIKSGGLNKFLFQPISYFPFRMCKFFGGKAVQSGILILLTIGVLVVSHYMVGSMLSLVRIFWFILIVILAVVLNFMMYYAISTMAFWVLEVNYLFWAMSLIINMASGGVFPLEVFGEKVLTASTYLPFMYTIYFPVNVLSGRISDAEIVKGIVVQIVWIAVFSGLSFITWKRGLNKYEAVGG